MDALDIGIAMLAIILLICVILSTEKNRNLEKEIESVVYRANNLIKHINELTTDCSTLLAEEKNLVERYDVAVEEMNRLNQSYLAALPKDIADRCSKEDIL